MVKFVSRKRTQQIMPAAFRVVVRTLISWDFSELEAARALGLGLGEFRSFRSKGLDLGVVDDDLFVRVSLFLGFERALKTLLVTDENILCWLNQTSDAPPFEDRTPKSVFLEGSATELRKVREFLERLLGGNVD